MQKGPKFNNAWPFIDQPKNTADKFSCRKIYTDKRAYNKQRTDAGKATGKSQEAPVPAGKTENPLNSF